LFGVRCLNPLRGSVLHLSHAFVDTSDETGAHPNLQGDRVMEAVSTNAAENLRKAIENLINVKLHDALAKPGGLDRLVAHRSMGVASFAVRQAERQLEDVLVELLPTETTDSYTRQDA
jgi:hypothetical protein